MTVQERARVLVIDDEPGVRDMLTYELGQEGFDVTCAPDGATAVELVRSQSFDVVVADFKMPGMNGAETVAALKLIEPGLEVIVATGYATTANVIECMKRGAYDLIEKPYDVGDLKRLLEAAMSKSHLDAVTSLYQASVALAAAVGQPELLQRAADVVSKAIPCAAAAILVPPTPHYPRTSVTARASLSQPFLEQIAASAAASSAPAILPAGMSAGPLTGPAGERFACAVVCPLAPASVEQGALLLFRDDTLPVFTPQEAKAAGVFAIEVGLAWSRERLAAAR